MSFAKYTLLNTRRVPSPSAHQQVSAQRQVRTIILLFSIFTALLLTCSSPFVPFETRLTVALCSGALLMYLIVVVTLLNLLPEGEDSSI